MSENREYVSRSDELGNIHISGEVLASIAAAAALEVEGVSRAECQPGQRHRGAAEQQEEPDQGSPYPGGGRAGHGGTGGADVLWTHHPEVGRAVQDAVKSSVESMTGLTVAAVNVGVGGITLEKKEQQTG